MKKIFALVACLSLVASLAVGGSIAYLQSTDSAVNVMTLGNVKIEQHEYERATNEDGTYKTDTIDNVTSYVLQDFSQSKPLLPIVGDPNEPGDSPAYKGWDDTVVRMTQVDSYGFMQVFAGKNAQDKFVTVENTGKSDAFVRTIVAIEVGSTDGKLIKTSARAGSEPAPWAVEMLDETVEIDGNNYMVYEYVYRGASDVNRHVNGILPEGDTTYPNLCQIYLKHNATNEDMVAIDGNENGKLDIIVLSQAVQAAGFEDAATALDTAFGPVDATNLEKWLSEVEDEDEPTEEPGDDDSNVVNPTAWVNDSDALAKAIEEGNTVIGLEEGTFHIPASAAGKTLTFVGESKEKSIIEVVPAGQGEANGQLDYSLDGSTVSFYDLTIKTNSQLYAGFARLSGTYNNCIIQNTYNLGVGNSEFNLCTFNITNEYLRVGGAHNATFNQCIFNTDGRAILVYQDGTNVHQTVTVKNCTFNATAAANTWNGIHVAAVSIDGQNGTYTVNLRGNNTVDSNFNGLYQIKAGEANVTVNQ